MSLISDIKSVTNSNNPANNLYSLYPYASINGEPLTSDLNIDLYGVLNQNIAQTNTIAVKPLEQGNFTVDSQQIKPYVINIRGVIYPSDNTAFVTGYTYESLSTWMQNEVDKLRNYLNGIQLFTLANMYSFTLYEPLKLVGINQELNVDLTLPEFTFQFQQVQTTTATNYSTTNTSKPEQVQNAPTISTQG